MSTKLIEFAKQAGLKGQSETTLSPQEIKFAQLILKEASTYVDIMFRQEFLKTFGFTEKDIK